MSESTARHVFISHSSLDNGVGKRVCDVLENTGIRCWYSSRGTDLEPGAEWEDTIVAALDKSAAVLLLFSAASNESKWVKREVAMASRRHLPIYPVRIEDVWPTGGMEAYLISVQWTDAFDGTVESRLGLIIEKLRALFSQTTPPVSEPALKSNSETPTQPKTKTFGPLADLSRAIDERYPISPIRRTGVRTDPNVETVAERTIRLRGFSAFQLMAILLPFFALFAVWVVLTLGTFAGLGSTSFPTLARKLGEAGSPLFYAMGAYAVFHFLDRKASNNAKRAVTAWLKDYHKAPMVLYSFVWLASKLQWYLKDGQRHPFDVFGYVAAFFVFILGLTVQVALLR